MGRILVSGKYVVASQKGNIRILEDASVLIEDRHIVPVCRRGALPPPRAVDQTLGGVTRSKFLVS